MSGRVAVVTPAAAGVKRSGPVPGRLCAMEPNAAPIIRSLLDTDLYKFTMWQAMLHRHPQAQAEYTFACRNRPERPLAGIVEQVNAQLDALCTLRFSEEELAWLGGLRFIRGDFVDFLRLFHFQRRFIDASAHDGELR